MVVRTGCWRRLRGCFDPLSVAPYVPPAVPRRTHLHQKRLRTQVGRCLYHSMPYGRRCDSVSSARSHISRSVCHSRLGLTYIVKWLQGNKMLTPTPCRGQPALVKPAGDMDSPVSFLRARAAAASPDQVTYPPRKQVDNAYTVELKGLLCPPMVDLFRVTHEHRPGLGFQPLVRRPSMALFDPLCNCRMPRSFW